MGSCVGCLDIDLGAEEPVGKMPVAVAVVVAIVDPSKLIVTKDKGTKLEPEAVTCCPNDPIDGFNTNVGADTVKLKVPELASASTAVIVWTPKSLLEL